MTETATEKKVRPEGLTEDHLKYLDDLRESGVTNMFGATPFLQEEFGLDQKTARSYLVYWMETFGHNDR